MRGLIVLSLLQILVHTTQSTPPKREILALWNLGAVSECVLHYFPSVYIEYGCWCGFRGAGKPVDEIDSCCMQLDKCYDAAVKSKVCFNVVWEYIDNYKWKCDNGTAICDKRNKPCGAALCACDVALAECWSHFPKPKERKKCTHETTTTDATPISSTN